MMRYIKGLDLARAFYDQLVRPILARHYPHLHHSAALIGSGSEVLGYDDAVSTDHHWGPRVMLFLTPADHRALARRIASILASELPYQFMGYSTNFSAPKTEDGDNGTQLLQNIDSGLVNHRVDILTLDGFMRDYLGIAADHRLSAADWLSIPQQKLLSFTSGAVYHDDLGIQQARDRLRFYPHDVWLYLLACGWSRIGQDEHLAPRAGALGDELGSALIASRLVRSVMQLCFLYEKRFAPYPKWFGAAFSELPAADSLSPILRAIQCASDFRKREQYLCDAYKQLNNLHNAQDLTAPIHPAIQPFHGRGFMVSNAWRYIEALVAVIRDSEVKAIAEQSLIGGIDQFSDNTDMCEAVGLRKKIANLYQA